MLVLSRKQNEKIRIGTDIIVHIISTSDNQVKIGIEAPGDVKILRDELYEKIKIESHEALNHSKDASKEALAKLKLNVVKKDAQSPGK